MRDWINILGGLAIFFGGLGWLAGGGGWIALLVMLGGGFGASQASIRRNQRLQQAHRDQAVAGQIATAGEGQRQAALLQLAAQGRLPEGLEVANCGHAVKRGSAFCSVCGASLGEPH